MQHKGERQPDSASDLALCLQLLTKEGRAAVSPRSCSQEDADALPLLIDLDACARQELALPLPGFSAEAALWGARRFYQLCRFVVCRDVGEDEIIRACAEACPKERGPETDWSVDLTLRHLPKLFLLARHLSNADPLLGQMKAIGGSWPLSSVGMSGLESFSLESFILDPGLRRLYCDRIIAAADLTRLGDSRVDDVLRADVGIHRELAPAFATKLFETTNDTN
jgi:MoxR-vWA-beta-propeller ternary system protein